MSKMSAKPAETSNLKGAPTGIVEKAMENAPLATRAASPKALHCPKNRLLVLIDDSLSRLQDGRDRGPVPHVDHAIEALLLYKPYE